MSDVEWSERGKELVICNIEKCLPKTTPEQREKIFEILTTTNFKHGMGFFGFESRLISPNGNRDEAMFWLFLDGRCVWNTLSLGRGLIVGPDPDITQGEHRVRAQIQAVLDGN